nr:MAG TPA: hypothetical protein [Caudoviricetes sp.]
MSGLCPNRARRRGEVCGGGVWSPRPTEGLGW